MKAASESGDISALLALMTSASSMKPADYIKNTLGNLRFLYYMYTDKLHIRPIDMEELVDGLLYIDAKAYIEDKILSEYRQKMERERQRSK